VTTVLNTIAETRDALGARRANGRIALVPTMGALHEGHLSLVERARELADTVVVSIFVNKLQFGPGEDFDRYPRTFDDDLRKLEDAGVDYCFAPSTEEMYPRGLKQTRVIGGPAAGILEGAHRLSHFDGVLTVVAKLFNIVRPDVAVFGEKDAQQLFLVQRMVADLDMEVEVVGAPIVREADGLARSSRNRYLSEQERALALTLSRALQAAASSGDLGIREMLAQAQGVFSLEPHVSLDYFSIVEPTAFTLVGDDYRGPGLALVAARVGSTRLIDNLPVVVGGHERA